MRFAREVELARRLALEAGRLASNFQERGVTAETKEDDSPVTAADRACERMIIEGIEREFPADGVLGEEGANREGSNGRRWIIDPIDGTRDFLRGIPLWAVLIGLEEEGEMIAAVAHSPRQNLLLWAALGEGAWAEGAGSDERLRVRDKSDVGQAVLCLNGFQKGGVDRLADRAMPWMRRFWAVRSMGGAVDAMLLAQGKADVWIEPSAAPWDLAPLKLIAEEAGCRFGSFDGRNTIYGGDAWACVPGLESQVREFVGAPPA